jgi:hypothetical protein
MGFSAPSDLFSHLQWRIKRGANYAHQCVVYIYIYTGILLFLSLLYARYTLPSRCLAFYVNKGQNSVHYSQLKLHLSSISFYKIFKTGGGRPLTNTVFISTYPDSPDWAEKSAVISGLVRRTNVFLTIDMLFLPGINDMTPVEYIDILVCFVTSDTHIFTNDRLYR